MNKIVVVMLAGMLVMCTLNATGGSIVLQPGAQQVAVGSTARLSVSASDIQNVHGYSVIVTYDPALLRYSKAAKESFLTGQTLFFVTNDSINGSLRIDEAILGSGTQSGSGALAQVEFVPRQEGQVSLEITGADVRDAQNQTITVTTAGAVLTVEGATEVGDEGTSCLRYMLGQNYPNPFNPITEIPYELSTGGHVSIIVVNALGEEVASLMNAYQSAGAHTVTWHAASQKRPLASGLYFCVLRSRDFRAITKMVLTK